MLRRPVRPGDVGRLVEDSNAEELTLQRRRSTPLRWQLSLLTALIVGLSVSLMTVAAYWTVSQSLSRSVDVSLEDKADSLLRNSFEPSRLFNPMAEIAWFKIYNPDIRVAYYAPGTNKPIGDSIPLVDEVNVLDGDVPSSVRSSGTGRIYARRGATGATVILARDMASTHQMISQLGFVLLLISGLGILIAIAAGVVVATAGLRPVGRLRRAVDRVASTDELKPITVVGNDELAQLTRAFNDMLTALAASRKRQADLVADAGHELKTPLTSLRTNIELLMMVADQSVAGKGTGISDKDRKDLQRDVIAQLDELAQLIGDLVDLAREDANPAVEIEEVDLDEVLETSLTRVRRRRPDVTFQFDTISWYMKGDPFSLGRATLNLMDNAAKWSPKDGIVRVKLAQKPGNDSIAVLTVSDSGPGIPVAEREKVFERFYRSIQARSMPGSGLGLAIVKQVILRHDGSIRAETSDDGGTCMRVELPGSPERTDT